MPSSVELDTRGIDSLIRNLGRDTERVMVSAREQVAQGARNRVPVRSGRLKNSIVVVGDEVQVTAPYASIVEAKEPFLEPAVEEQEPTVERALEAVIRRLGKGSG